MQFVKPNTNINFIGKRHIAFILSSIMLLTSIISIIAHRGLNYGIDFTGGTLIQMKFESPVSTNQIKSELLKSGFKASTIQTFGNIENHEFLIKTLKTGIETHLSEKIKSTFNSANTSNSQIRRIEMVGPQVGKDLREKALLAMFYAILLIAIYISGRFELKWALSCIIAFSLMSVVYFLSFLEVTIPIIILIALILTISIFRFMKLGYAMGAILALLHDVIITIGIFSILDKEFSLSIIAALLTTVGYSLNDTIIVFDRIRENLRKYNKKKQLAEIINKSINETLGRTVLTSLTTLMVVLTLLVLGGEIIHDFAFALVIGVIVGTFSSIYVASPILLSWQKQKNEIIRT